MAVDTRYEKRLILEGRRYSTDSVGLSRAALASGWDVLRVIDYTYEDDGVKPIIYASKWLATIVSAACGVEFVHPPNDWLAGLPERYLKRRVSHHVGAVEWPTERAFIKCCDSKWMTARVYEPGEMAALAELMDEDGIIISEPVIFETEFRTFVLDGRVMDVSSYMAAGQPTQVEDGWLSFPQLEETAVRFVEGMLADPAVDAVRSLVVDVGFIMDRGWAVVEANESWYSGIYACDRLKVLETIEGAVTGWRDPE